MASDGTALTGLWFDGQKYFADTLASDRMEKTLPVFRDAVRWLDIYFSGREPGFTPPLNMRTRPFRKAVWKIMLTIPFGKTMTYGEVASIVAAKRNIPRMSAQAVGGAVGSNPIAIIVPCHRVIGANGKLVGYAAGLDKKQKLLEIEGVTIF